MQIWNIYNIFKAIVEVLFQSFSPIISNIILMEKFLYEVGEYFICSQDFSNMANLNFVI